MWSLNRGGLLIQVVSRPGLTVVRSPISKILVVYDVRMLMFYRV